MDTLKIKLSERESAFLIPPHTAYNYTLNYLNIMKMNDAKHGPYYRVTASVGYYYRTDAYELAFSFDKEGYLFAGSCQCKKIQLYGSCRHIIFAADRINHLQISEAELPLELNNSQIEDQLRQLYFLKNCALDYRRYVRNLKERRLNSLRTDFKPQLNLRLQVDYSIRYYNDTGLDLSFKLNNNGGRYYVIHKPYEFVRKVRNSEFAQFGSNYWKLDYSFFTDQSKMIFDFLDKYARMNDYYFKLRINADNIDDFFDLLVSLPTAERPIAIMEETAQPLHLKVAKVKNYITLQFDKNQIDNCLIGNKALYKAEDDKLLTKQQPFDPEGRIAELLDIQTGRSDPIVLAEAGFKSFYQEYLNGLDRYLSLECAPGLELKQYESTVRDIKLFADLEEGLVKVWGSYIEDEKEGSLFQNQAAYPIPFIETIIRHYADSINGNYATFKTGNNALSAFLDQGIGTLQKVAAVFISEDLMALKYRKQVNLNIGIKMHNDLLSINFSGNVTKEELTALLHAYRKKKQFYRLKNGQIITLGGQSLAKFAEVVDKLHLSKKELEKETVERPFYDAIHLNEYRDDLDTRSKAHIDEYSEKLAALKKKQDLKLDEKYLKILRPYQLKGIEWLKDLHDVGLNGILADDMGLGKTLQVLVYLERFAPKCQHLIVCPSSLMFNWLAEINKFQIALDTVCINGPQDKRAMLIGEEHTLYITTYDYLKRDIAYYRKKKFAYLILDEAQYIKNPATKNAISVKTLTAAHRLALTGTPIENSLSELWSIFDFLLPGYLFDRNYFAKNYEKPIQLNQDEAVAQKLKTLTEPFILRRTKKEVLKDLPDKIAKDLWLNFSEEEEKLYLANLATVNRQLQEQLALDNVDSILIIAMITKLRQLCCEPRMLYAELKEPSTKLLTCVDLIEQLKHNRKKVLLFSSFTSIFPWLITIFNEKGIKYHLLTGQTAKKQRKAEIDAFQSDDSDIFLISLKAGGTGLNLTKAEAVIHYDPWWNLSAQNQATDRAYRIGQTKNVLVFQLLMKNTIEEKIYELQQKKKEISEMFVENSKFSLARMSADELRNLFAIK